MKKRKGKSSSSSGNEDRISNLPDALIHQILSFIDMKYVVQTCLLSKRWRYIWASLQVLRFTDYLHKDEENDWESARLRFVNFVNKVLSLRDNSDIHAFHLYGSHNGMTDVYKWIATAVSYNVQELSIEICTCEDFEIPACLCTCKSLTKLKLDLDGAWPPDNKVILPTEICLPRLKSLLLLFRYIPFNGEELASKFFSSMPSLESLKMICYGRRASMNLNVSSLPNLESLFMRKCGFHGMNLNISFPKLKYFELDNGLDNFEMEGEIHENTADVKLYAPSLASFILYGYMPTSFIPENLSSLVKADMGIWIKEEDKGTEAFSEVLAEKKKHYTKRTMRFLKGLRYAKVLELNDSFLKALGGSPDTLLNSQALEFHNLHQLELSVRLSRDSIRSIFYMLNVSPNIGSLSLTLDPENPTLLDEVFTDNSVCSFYHSLKFVKIIHFRGHENELRILEILLKRALVLEKVELCSFASIS